MTVLSEQCPKCGQQMFNNPRSITRCAKCGHEWSMKEPEIPFTSNQCDVCGEPATQFVLKDPFGKSNETRPLCGQHGLRIRDPADVAEIERLTRELAVQKGVNDLAYIPHRALVESRDGLQKRYDKVEAERDRLRAALNDLIRAYVNLLEAGKDRIESLGGDCDPVDVMERADPHLRKAREALSGEPTSAPYQMTANEESSFTKALARKRVPDETSKKSADE